LPTSEQALHHGDVEPAVELAADFDLDADQAEAARFVERARGGAAGFDAGEHGMKARLAGNLEQRGEEQAADSSAGQ